MCNGAWTSLYQNSRLVVSTIWWTDFEAKNENDLEISDVESGLSIRDFGENDDIIEETGSNGDDIERPMTTVPVLTKDKLVRFFQNWSRNNFYKLCLMHFIKKFHTTSDNDFHTNLVLKKNQAKRTKRTKWVTS